MISGHRRAGRRARCPRSLLILCTVAIALVAPAVANAGTVTAAVEGAGTLTGTAGGIPGALVCPPHCESAVPDGTAIEISAAPGPGASFLGWGGACASASGQVCAFTVMGDTALSARFTVPAPSPAPPARPVLARQRHPFLEDVTLAGRMPACAGSCDERLIGVLRDGRLALLRDTAGARVVSTVRVAERTGLGARAIARVRTAGLLDSIRLSTDRRVVLWESTRTLAIGGVLVPSGRRVSYPPARMVGVAPDSDVDRVGGRLLIDVAVGPAGLREALLIRPAARRAPRRFIPTPRGSVGARLSPDGRRVAYIVLGRLVVRPVRGGSPRTLTPASSDAADGRWFAGGVAPGVRVGWSVSSLAWSRDGTRIAAVVGFGGADLSSAILSVRPDGGDLRALAVRSGASGHVDWLPDGDVAFQATLLSRADSKRSSSAIGFVDAATGAVSYLLQPGVNPPG